MIFIYFATSPLLCRSNIIPMLFRQISAPTWSAQYFECASIFLHFRKIFRIIVQSRRNPSVTHTSISEKLCRFSWYIDYLKSDWSGESTLRMLFPLHTLGCRFIEVRQISSFLYGSFLCPMFLNPILILFLSYWHNAPFTYKQSTPIQALYCYEAKNHELHVYL